ncbi:MAG: hypothetical protein KKA64_04005 [Nanoarchaeota archaeon]|nr:hypothetical protein [Nanoarchaeota archaeon]
MAFLETVIVFYLRKLYYPAGFQFPLTPISSFILNIEWVREFFTIVMLLCVAFITGKKFYERFAYFLYSFAIWDIFYYIWLKVLLDWPASLLTWDLLFLIPFPWLGPVLAPLICSLTMIFLALCILILQDKKKNNKLNLREWILLVLGALIIQYTFLYDFASLIIKNGLLSNCFDLMSNQKFLTLIYSYIPVYYNWLIFSIGEAIILLFIFLFIRRYFFNH